MRLTLQEKYKKNPLTRPAFKLYFGPDKFYVFASHSLKATHAVCVDKHQVETASKGDYECLYKYSAGIPSYGGLNECLILM